MIKNHTENSLKRDAKQLKTVRVEVDKVKMTHKLSKEERPDSPKVSDMLHDQFYQSISSRRNALSDTMTDDQALMTLFKSTVGTGILAVPEAFSNAGLWFGLFFLIFTVIVNVHCLRLLVKTSHYMCARFSLTSLDYGGLAEHAVMCGPAKLRSFKNKAKLIINISLGLSQLGMCSVYFVFIAEHAKQALDPNGHLSLATHMALLLPIFFLLCSIRQLKYLAIPSLLANVAYLVALVITFYYIFLDLPPWQRLPAIQSLDRLPLAFGSLMFAFGASGTILPIENKTKFPERMNACNGILNTSSALSTLLYIALGFYGYIRFGSSTMGSITLNLPDNNLLYNVAKLMVCLSICISFPMQYYVPMQLVIGYLEKKIAAKKRRAIVEYAIRYLLVMITFAFAELVPNLGLFISLVGALTTSALTFIFPPLIELFVRYRDSACDPKEWRFLILLNVLIIVFGLSGLLAGTTTSITLIIKTFY